MKNKNNAMEDIATRSSDLFPRFLTFHLFLREEFHAEAKRTREVKA